MTSDNAANGVQIDMPRVSSPCSRIPPEVMRPILLYSMPTEDSWWQSLGSRERFRNDLAIARSAVCTYWRDIALSTPDLWTSVLAHPLYSLDGLRSSLERSQDRPLDIYLDPGHHSGIAAWTIRVMMVIAHIDRVLSLHVGGHLRHLFRTLSQLESTGAPLLAFLDLDAIEQESPILDYNFASHIFGGGAPTLAFIQCHRLSLRACRPPMSAITKLSLRDTYRTASWNGEEIHEIIHETWESLEELSIHGQIQCPENTFAFLPKLRCLRLSGRLITTPNDPVDQCSTYNLLKSIFAPELSLLSLAELRCPISSEIFETRSGISFIPKYPHLKTLVFSQGLYLCGFAPLFPTLTTLTILGCNPHAAVHELMTAVVDQITDWRPQIQTLTLNPLFCDRKQDKRLEKDLCNLITYLLMEDTPIQRLRVDSTSWLLLSESARKEMKGKIEIELLGGRSFDHIMEGTPRGV